MMRLSHLLHLCILVVSLLIHSFKAEEHLIIKFSRVCTGDASPSSSSTTTSPASTNTTDNDDDDDNSLIFFNATAVAPSICACNLTGNGNFTVKTFLEKNIVIKTKDTVSNSEDYFCSRWENNGDTCNRQGREGEPMYIQMLRGKDNSGDGSSYVFLRVDAQKGYVDVSCQPTTTTSAPDTTSTTTTSSPSSSGPTTTTSNQTSSDASLDTTPSKAVSGMMDSETTATVESTTKSLNTTSNKGSLGMPQENGSKDKTKEEEGLMTQMISFIVLGIGVLLVIIAIIIVVAFKCRKRSKEADSEQGGQEQPRKGRRNKTKGGQAAADGAGLHTSHQSLISDGGHDYEDMIEDENSQTFELAATPKKRSRDSAPKASSDNYSHINRVTGGAAAERAPATSNYSHVGNPTGATAKPLINDDDDDNYNKLCLNPNPRPPSEKKKTKVSKSATLPVTSSDKAAAAAGKIFFLGDDNDDYSHLNDGSDIYEVVDSATGARTPLAQRKQRKKGAAAKDDDGEIYTDCLSPKLNGSRSNPKMGGPDSPKLGRSSSTNSRKSWRKRKEPQVNPLADLDVTKLPLPKDPYCSEYEIPDTTGIVSRQPHPPTGGGGLGVVVVGVRGGSPKHPPKLPTSPPPGLPPSIAPPRTTNLSRHNSRSVDNVARVKLLRSARDASKRHHSRPKSMDLNQITITELLTNRHQQKVASELANAGRNSPTPPPTCDRSLGDGAETIPTAVDDRNDEEDEEAGYESIEDLCAARQEEKENVKEKESVAPTKGQQKPKTPRQNSDYQNVEINSGATTTGAEGASSSLAESTTEAMSSPSTQQPDKFATNPALRKVSSHHSRSRSEGGMLPKSSSRTRKISHDANTASQQPNALSSAREGSAQEGSSQREGFPQGEDPDVYSDSPSSAQAGVNPSSSNPYQNVDEKGAVVMRRKTRGTSSKPKPKPPVTDGPLTEAELQQLVALNVGLRELETAVRRSMEIQEDEFDKLVMFDNALYGTLPRNRSLPTTEL